MSEIILRIDGVNPVELYGEKNSKLDVLKKAYPNLIITSRGTQIKLSGDTKEAQDCKSKIEKMMRMLKHKQTLTVQTVQDLLNGGEPDVNHLPASTDDNKNVIVYGRNGRPIRAKTKNQKKLVEYSEKNDVVFAIGPAGTGKTYTAVALAVSALKNKIVKKIILTRPAVEAGESLGFLPGDLKDKVDPYLRPLYDALDDMFPHEKLDHFMDTRIIEVAPLAFMRGRTLDHAFIILDEAQNCTNAQIKMFLTRLGPSAKCIITGDMSQVDLPRNQTSGLIQALDILSDVRGIGQLFLTAEDVVRHRLVKEIILRYDKAGNIDSNKANRKSEYRKTEDAKAESAIAVVKTEELAETKASATMDTTVESSLEIVDPIADTSVDSTKNRPPTTE